MKDDKTYGEGWCWDDDNPTLSPLLISRKDIFLSRFVKRLNDMGINYLLNIGPDGLGRIPSFSVEALRKSAELWGK